MNEQEIKELFERSKNDRAIIVGSEVRALCDLALSALRPAEPMAWMNPDPPMGIFSRFKEGADNFGCTMPLFAAPPAESAEVWIAVSERLPEANRWVLVHNGKWTGVGVYRPAPTYANEPEEYWQDEHCEFIELLGPKITHWQPLPTPPLAARSAR